MPILTRPTAIRQALACLLLGTLSPWSGEAAEPTPCQHPHHAEDSPHHPVPDMPPESDGIHFHPHLNLAIALGGSTSEKNLELLGGAHAPLDDGFNLQGIEFGGLLELGERLTLQANAIAFWDRLDGWDGELEEAFFTFGLPGDTTLRAGLMLVPFGLENQLHIHDRAFVEAPLSVVRLLGEEGLVAQGAELTLPLPRRWSLRVGAGHGDEHNHGKTRDAHREAWFEAVEHAAAGHEEDDGEEEEEAFHSHGFAGAGGVYDPEQAYLTGPFGYLRIDGPLQAAVDGGFSFAFGENDFDRNTWLAGADLHGDFQLAGRPAWWRAEAFYRQVEAIDAAGIPGDFTESGIHAALGCEFAEDWSAAARLEWASGNRLAGLERRWRFAANLGRAFHFGERADSHARLQYTYDRLGGYADEHTIWLQWVFNLGAAHHSH